MTKIFSGITRQLSFLAACMLTLSAMFQGCSYDNEADLYPKSDCDTANVTYSQTIAPIMSASCNVCHSGGNPSAGVITDNYDGLSVVAKNGKLLEVISWTGSIKMPADGEQLSDCNQAKIRIWVNEGSKNN